MVGFIRISLLTVATWGLIGIATWSLYSIPQPGKVVAAAAHRTEPELFSPPDLKADLALLNKQDVWGARAVAANTTPAQKTVTEVWSRVAVVKEANGAFVLLASPSGEIKPFKVGDVLPDGGKLSKVSTAEVIVQNKDGKKSYRLLE